MNKSLKKAIEIIKYATKHNISLAEACQKFNKKRNFVADKKYSLKKQYEKGQIDHETYENFLYIYLDWEEQTNPEKRNKSEHEDLDTHIQYEKSKIIGSKNNDCDSDDELVEYDSSVDDDYDSRSVGHPVYDENENIIKYYYRIEIRDQAPLEGYFTREEMDKVYRLYSNMDGAGLTQREVAREFPHLTSRDFKRILRAFNITKSSIPVAPHTLLEEPLEKVKELVLKSKEDNLLKILNHQRSKHFEKAYIDAKKEIIELKNTNLQLKNIIEGIDIEKIEPIHINKEILDDEKALIICLSDMHVGAMTEKNSIYKNKWNEKEFRKRLEIVLEELSQISKTNGKLDNLFIFNLGDALDGYNSKTTRGGHDLPQNMNNKEQFTVYVEGMLSFFEALHRMGISNNIEYHCVTNDNHSGDFGFIANKSLDYISKYRFPDMKINIIEKFIDHINYGVHTFILTHGKDDKDRKYGFPLYLDQKTELFFNQYIDIHRIFTPEISIYKGDLHQSSICYGKKFRYKNVSSLYGSSNWIHNNFGYTRPGVDYEIVHKNKSHILSGLINIF